MTDNSLRKKDGDVLRVTIGIEDYLDTTTIDLTDKAYAGTKRTVVSIPARVIARAYSGNIIIKGKDFTLTLNPKAFDTSKAQQHKDRDDAGVRFEVTPYDGSLDLAGKTSLSPQYTLKSEFFLGTEATGIDQFASPIELVMEYDKAKADLRKLDDVALYRYDGYAGEWIHISQRLTKDSFTVKAVLNRAGRYAIIGARGDKQ